MEMYMMIKSSIYVLRYVHEKCLTYQTCLTNLRRQNGKAHDLFFGKTKVIRSRQGSNLRGETPLDFKSNALTTRPRLLAFSMYRTLFENKNKLFELRIDGKH